MKKTLYKKYSLLESNNKEDYIVSPLLLVSFPNPTFGGVNMGTGIRQKCKTKIKSYSLKELSLSSKLCCCIANSESGNSAFAFGFLSEPHLWWGKQVKRNKAKVNVVGTRCLATRKPMSIKKGLKNLNFLTFAFNHCFFEPFLTQPFLSHTPPLVGLKSWGSGYSKGKKFSKAKTKDTEPTRLIPLNSVNIKREEYILETFKRSNQDTCLTHKPAVREGSWVQKGDLLTDCASSIGGELSLGQNLLIAYMPWEGYNFEDAILISERLVMDDLYTSVHIERYEFETQQTKFGKEEITRDIPDVSDKELNNLDSCGIVKLGSWVEEGDILVGKITPINKKKISPYQKLLYTILEKQVRPIKDSSLRAPKGIKAKVIDIKYFIKKTRSFSHQNYNLFSKDSLLKGLSQKKVELKQPNRTKSSKLKSENANVIPYSCSPFYPTFSGVQKRTEQNVKKINFLFSKKFNNILNIRFKLFSSKFYYKFPLKEKTLLKLDTVNLKDSITIEKLINQSKQKVLKNLNEKHGNLFLHSIYFNSRSYNSQYKTIDVEVNPLQKKSLKLYIEPQLKTKKHYLFPLLALKGGGSKKQLAKVNKTFAFAKAKANLNYESFQKDQSLSNLTQEEKTKLSNIQSMLINPRGFKQQNSEPFLIKRTFSFNIREDNNNQLLPLQNFFQVKRNYQRSKLGFAISTTEGLKTANEKFLKKNNLLKEIEKIQIYLAEKRKIQVGDKMAGRHGNKGIVSKILPIQDMPYLPDGTSIDMVLNPLGVPSRMNVGQIYECLLGLAGKFLGENYKIPSFDEIYGPEASRSFVFSKLYEARLKTGLKWLFDPNTPGKIRLFDGRNGYCFDQKVTAGQAYMLRLVHMVDDKIHTRSTGPYSLVTQQPLRGRSKQGGQRLGEMEVWALEGYGAAFTLLEMLTIKSDDMTGRMTLWSNLILNKDISIGTPESFKVLICELQALCLDIGLFRNIEINNSTFAFAKAKVQKTNLREINNLMNLP